MEISKIDTSFVFDHNNVVHVQTYQEAIELTLAVREKFSNWGEYEDDPRTVYGCWTQHEEETCLRFNYRDGVIHWGYCHYGFYLKEGKHIIQFDELLNVADYGEIHSGNVDFDAAVAALF